MYATRVVLNDPYGRYVRSLHAHEAERLVRNGLARRIGRQKGKVRMVEISGLQAGDTPAPWSRVYEEAVTNRSGDVVAHCYAMTLVDTTNERGPAVVRL